MDRPSHLALRPLLAALAVAVSIPFSTGAGATRLATPRTSDPDSLVPALDHIVVVIMENKNYDSVRLLPYTASLIGSNASFSASFAITHPSQPNYLALWSGSTQGVTNDACPPPGSPYSTENLGHACEAAGLTWRAYSENLPAVGSGVCTAGGTLYTRKHDPWTDFSNLDHTRERTYNDLLVDEAGGTLPNLAFVIPNNCHNSHDTGCTAAAADVWLSQNMPAMITAAGPHGLVVLTWDEDDGSAFNHILTVFVGPRVRTGYLSATHITHYTLLRTLCAALRIAPFGAALQETPITDVWISDVVGVQQSSWCNVKRMYR